MGRAQWFPYLLLAHLKVLMAVGPPPGCTCGCVPSPSSAMGLHRPNTSAFILQPLTPVRQGLWPGPAQGSSRGSPELSPSPPLLPWQHPLLIVALPVSDLSESAGCHQQFLGLGWVGALRAPTLPACQFVSCLSFPEGDTLA